MAEAATGRRWKRRHAADSAILSRRCVPNTQESKEEKKNLIAKASSTARGAPAELPGNEDGREGK